MNILKIYLFSVLAFIFTAGCASTPYQSDSALKNLSTISSSKEIQNVPFIEQAARQCGPATLAMAMQWSGKNITPDDLSPKMFNPEMKGSLQIDLISAARREGMMAIPLEGFVSLLKEIDGGHPVIVFQNLGLGWYPIWHYALAIGYDLNTREIVLHSGPDAAKRVGFKRFENSWQKADYWGLVVLKPSVLSATGDEVKQMVAAAGLEQTGHEAEAKIAYETTLKRWPKSLTAFIGLGNIAYKKNDYSEAVRVLKKAVEFHPDSSVAQQNLRVATRALLKK